MRRNKIFFCQNILYLMTGCKKFLTQKELKIKMSLPVQHPGKDNIVMIIEKNTTPEEDELYEYPYYIARIQRRFINTKKRWFKAQYSHHRFIME